MADSLRAATVMRERAVQAGMTLAANTEVVGLDVEHGRIKRVRTTRGDIEAERVVIACGCWSPRIAAMAGAKIPLTPAVHQMIDIGPVPMFAASRTLVDYPIVRDMDTNMYERQDGGGLEIGSYAHRPILMDADEIPSIEESALSPTELPFTQADFEPQLEQALELMPEIVGDESVGQRYGINGLLSVTHDGAPLLGETPEVRGLWSAAAIWIKEGPGAGGPWPSGWSEASLKSICSTPTSRAPIATRRRNPTSALAPTRASTRCTGSSTRPSSGSPTATSSCRLSTPASVSSAPSSTRRGLGAPALVQSNASLLDEFGDRVGGRESEWEARWWSPIINAEHLAMRDRAGYIDLTAFAIFDVTGPAALDVVQKVAMRQMDVAVGRACTRRSCGRRAGSRPT